MELQNSQRRIYKATYAPVDAPAPAMPEAQAWPKLRYIDALRVQTDEIRSLQQQANGQPAHPRPAQYRQLLTTVAGYAADREPDAALRHAAEFARFDLPVFEQLGEALAARRTSVADSVATAVKGIRADYEKTRGTSQATLPATSGKLGAANASSLKAATLVNSLGVTVGVSNTRSTWSTEGAVAQPAAGKPFRFRAAISAQAASSAASALATRLPPAPTTLHDAMAWSATADTVQWNRLTDLLTPYRDAQFVMSALTPAEMTAAIGHLTDAVGAAPAAVRALQSHIQITPVGRLHLERLDMTSVGIERGELLSSIPLAPQETVNFSHREWATTTQEFETIVTDSFEGYSEEGVAEKSELSQSTDSQSKHSTALKFEWHRVRKLRLRHHEHLGRPERGLRRSAVAEGLAQSCDRDHAQILGAREKGPQSLLQGYLRSRHRRPGRAHDHQSQHDGCDACGLFLDGAPLEGGAVPLRPAHDL